MGPRSRERGHCAADDSVTSARFASMGPRSRERGHLSPHIDVPKHPKLQWGRAHVSADIRARTRSLHRSLGLQWGRAHVSADISFSTFPLPPFAKLQWGRAHVSADMSLSTLSFTWINLLQWGRAHVSADITAAEIGEHFRVSASMGPRSRERGHNYVERAMINALEASMGPRSRERGHQPATPETFSATSLQWGRAHVSADMRRRIFVIL